MHITAPLLLTALLLHGCATQYFENRVLCTLDSQSARIISQWGAFGLSVHLVDADARYICRPALPDTPIKKAP